MLVGKAALLRQTLLFETLRERERNENRAVIPTSESDRGTTDTIMKVPASPFENRC